MPLKSYTALDKAKRLKANVSRSLVIPLVDIPTKPIKPTCKNKNLKEKNINLNKNSL